MLVDYQTLVTELVRDDAAKIAVAERDRAITAAVLRYSTDKPRTRFQDVTPEVAQKLPLPAAWEAGFSALMSIEHPIGDIPPTFLDQERYGLYEDAAQVTKILLADGVAVAAANTRVGYTIKHVVDAVTDTIPLQHREPVACWAAALLCDQLAAFYSSGVDSTIQADSVEQRSKAQEYSSRARTYRKRYLDELGIGETKGAAAGVVVNLDQQDSRGEDRLTHGNRYR